MQTADLVRFIKSFPAVVAAAVILLGCFAYKFLLTADEDWEGQISDAQRELRKINGNLRNAVGIEDDLQALQTLADRIPELLMDREREILNLGYFYQLERRTGARVIRAEQRPVEDALTNATGLKPLQNFIAIPFDLALTGSSQEVSAYLKELRQDRFWTRLHTLTVNLDAQPGSLSGETRAEMRLFILGNPPPPPPAPDKKAS
jgi:hypothetical protein